jgi:hypothetical protein
MRDRQQRPMAELMGILPRSWLQLGARPRRASQGFLGLKSGRGFYNDYGD